MVERDFGRLSFWQVLGYDLGIASEVVTLATVLLLGMPIYSIALGVSPVLVGLVFFIPRVIDAITDPLMGYISDNTRSPWGRRRPYIVVGGILTGLSYALMWIPWPGFGEWGLFAYFLITSTFFYLAFTVFYVPYYAFGNEITYDPIIRKKVMSYRNLIWGIVTLLCPWTYSLCFSPYFGTGPVEGVRIVGILVGTLVMIASVIPAMVSKENMEVQKQPPIRFFEAMRHAVKNKAFLILTVVRTMTIFGMNLINTMLIYLLTYRVYKGDMAAGAKLYGFVGTAWAIGAIITTPMIERIIQILGTKKTLYLSLLLCGGGQLLFFVCLTPNYPYLSLLPFFVLAPGITGLFAVTSVWLADVCDYDDYLYGKRREGIYSSAFSFLFKFGTSMASFLSGILIAIAGINTAAGSMQTQASIDTLNLFNAFVPQIFVILSASFALFYPLTEKRMAEIKAVLDARSFPKREQYAD